MNLYHFHSQKIDRLLSSNFWMFETSVWLHSIGRSLISVFIPILLLVSGFSLEMVILYYFFFYVIDIPLNLLARACTIKLGARFSIILATVFTILFFITLGQLSSTDPIIYLVALAVFAAVYDAFYWVSHLFLFMEIEQGKKMTKAGTGFLYAVRKFGTLLGPLVGALFLIFISEDALIFVSIIFFVISIIPLFKLHNLDDRPKKVQPINVKKLEPAHKFVFINHMIWTLHRITESTIWPIFIFIVFETIQSVAAISIIASITSIIFSFFSGKLSNNRSHKLILFGTFIILFTWIFRMFFHAPVFYYLSVIVVGFVTLFISLPLDSNIFNIGVETNPLNTSTLRNTASMITGSIFFGVLLLLVGVFQISFIIAALAVFSFMVILIIFRKKYTID